MVLFLVGIGLCDEQDITLRGLDAVRSCSRLFLESYTSILQCSVDRLEALYGRKVECVYRDDVEGDVDAKMLHYARDEDVALLVVGDPFCATTHSDIFVRARKSGIAIQVIPNSGIVTAVCCCGLQQYNFGPSISLCFWTDSWKPDSWYGKLSANFQRNLHTLILLDIKVRERTEENLVRPIFEKSRFMLIPDAISQLFEVENQHNENVCGPESVAVGLARVGSFSQKIVFGTLDDLQRIEWGPPPHCLVLPSRELHPCELEHLDCFRV